MDKKRLEIATFAVIGIAILAIWGWQSFKSEAPRTQEPAFRTPEVKEVRIEEETSEYKINVSYPEFRNLGDASREEAVNYALKAKVDQSITALKSASREAGEFSPEVKSEIQVDYQTVNVNPWVASIKLRESTYVEGAAHPLDIFWPFNYNFKDNKEIVLADLFKPGSNYLEVLSDIASENLKSQLKEYYAEEILEVGTAPQSENFSTFFPAKDKLIIIFNVYSVAAYAAGPQIVEVPYNKLAEVIDQDGLIKLVRE